MLHREVSTSRERRAPVRARRVLAGSQWWHLPPAGVIGASVFIHLSLTPSLLPRPWLTQGVIAAVTGLMGYALAVSASYLAHKAFSWELPPRLRRAAWRALLLAVAVSTVFMLGLAHRWEQELHRLAGLPGPPWWYGIAVLVVTVPLFLSLLAVGRLSGQATRAAVHRLAPGLSRRGAVGASLLIGLVAVGVVRTVLFGSLAFVVDSSFRVRNAHVDHAEPAPDSAFRSGGPGSLAPFETLGPEGRDFVTGGPGVEDITRWRGEAAAEPIRIYAGLDSAPTLEARASLAVQELERTGGLDRSVVTIVTTTGTGWVNPVAVDALEYLHGGDTAVVALQYSYLPSWLAVLTDREIAARAGDELITRVERRRAELPPDQRPLLLLYGESLGSFSGESAFRDLDDVAARMDGVLWVGPPQFNPLRTELVARRELDSLQRLPVVDAGRTVRFAEQPGDLGRTTGDWLRPRVVYLQQASDAVVWWSPALAVRRPDWLAEPRSEHLLQTMRWYPLVTFQQVSADLLTAGRAPPGHGHNYGTKIVDAWHAIAGPADVDRRQLESLRRLLAAQ